MADQDTFMNGIEILDSSVATSSSGSLYTFGGISILNTTNASVTSASFLTLGGSYIVGNTIIGGNTSILSTTISTNTTTGAFIVNGGIGISGSAYGNFANFSNIQAIVGATLPNLITTTATIPNLISSNLIATTSASIPNLIVNNASIGSLSLSSFNPSNITTNNVVIVNSSSIANSIIVNNSVSNSFITNSTITNSFITNLNTTNLSVNSLNLTNLTSANAFFTNTTTTNLMVTTNANIAGIALQYYTGTPSGSWINMPIGAGSASGIGNSGPGISPWIAYAGSSGYWFTNSSPGDICYRNVSGSLQFGTDTGISVMQISNRIITINPTIESTTTSTGALIISGGLAIQKNINIGGNTIINGNLTVNGTTISVNSTTVNIADNIIVLNSGPSGTADGGTVINRFQIDNNTGAGDVVSGSEPIAFTGTVQTGTSTTVVVLPSGASAVDSFYNNWWIKITSGTANNNVRQIVSYVGSTKTATLSSVFTSTPSAGSDTFNLYNRVFVANYFKESLKEFTLSYISSNPGSIITDVTYANLHLGNLTSILTSTSNLIATNATISNFTLPTNITITNLVSTNSSLGNVFGTNLNFTNATITNFTSVNVTFNNLLSTNSTLGSIFGTNLNYTNSTLNNMVSTNSTFGNIFGTNLNYTNASLSNVVSTNSSLGSVFGTNFNYTNATLSNLRLSNVTFSNLVSTNSSFGNVFGSNLNYTNITSSNISATNISVSNIANLNLVTTNIITTGNLLITGNSTTSNTLTIDAQGSQTNPAAIIFKNTGGTGDFRIYGDGGDIQWQGGGSRALQMGGFHEIRLLGGRNNTSNISFINGSNSTFNTIIQNTNDSIALRIQANSTQTVDLQQWVNNSGTIYSKIDNIGNLVINSTADSNSSITGGSIITAGGVSIAKSVDIGSTNIATNTSTGALIVSGGGGFNGNIYANNIYTNGLQLGTYGTEYNYNELLGTTGTTSVNFTQRVSMTTSSLIGGTYKINIGYTYDAPSSTSSDGTFWGLLDPTALSTGTLIHEYIDRAARNTTLKPQYSSVIKTLTAGIHIVSLIYKTQSNGQSIYISNARLELFRVQ
jgi:uncharacterized protein YjbI with pentapeptide repeats